MELERFSYDAVSSGASLNEGVALVRKKNDEDQSEPEEEDHPIKWINIILLPFQFWWQTIILYLVCVKCFFGPMRAAQPFLTCSTEVDSSTVLRILKITYVYVCDVVYTIDTFIFVLHRQVADEAVKHEYLPKSVFLILIDVLSLIPFYGMFIKSECKVENIWPNILTFSELLKVSQYFSLNLSHNYWKLLTGYIIMFVLVLNATTCFLMLFTIHGLCDKCFNNSRYDWRAYQPYLNKSKSNYNLAFYIYACEYVFSLMANYMTNRYKARTYIEFLLTGFIMLAGYLTVILVIMPKLFAENILRLRPIYDFHPRAKRIIEETKRRNSLPAAYRSLENFYRLIWKKRDGITSIPKGIGALPMSIRIKITEDLIYPLFHHSPTFRSTSHAFRRWVGMSVTIKYKLPGERLFTGLHCYTDLYYIKTGVIQFLANDDSTVPLLSVESGTILGDVNFFVPPMNRKVIVRCLTYCQIIKISRAVILRALHKFPEDRRKIMELVQERLQHAHDLYHCKQKVRGLDRSDDEGIAWIKQRWWEINKNYRHWNKSLKKTVLDVQKDEDSYHCPKYIGQLVLCDEQKLQKKPIFVNVKFPFILNPNSSFVIAWNRIVVATIYFVLFVYPPNLMRQAITTPVKFLYASYIVDLIFSLDIIILLITAPDSEIELQSYLGTVIYERIKKKSFVLDVLSTVWIEKSLVLVLGAKYAGIISFNRLIKTYLLFFNRYENSWNKNQDYIKHVIFILSLSTFCYIYYFSYIMYVAVITTDLKNEIIVHDHFGHLCSEIFIKANLSDATKCVLTGMRFGSLEVALGWLIKLVMQFNYISISLYDIALKNSINLFTIVFFLYHKMKFVATLYLKNAEKINYQYFVSNLKKHYIKLKIHPTLLKRLDNYLNCHWKYYHGSDIIHPNLLRDEPYDVYWKLHGEIAENIIAQSSAFKGADPELIRQLALKAKFLILPKDSTLILFGSQIDKVTWVFRGYLKSVFNNEKGEIMNVFAPRGNILSLGSVFLGRISIRTFIAESDVEILYLNMEEFYRIIKRFPEEMAFFTKCKEEFLPIFDKMYLTYLRKHRYYKKQLQDSLKQKHDSKVAGRNAARNIRDSFKEFRTNPESKLLRCWMTFRVIVLFSTLILRPSYFMSVWTGRAILEVIIYSTDAIAIVHIIIRMFVPYYDERGLIISSARKCAFHYLTTSFIADVIGTILGIIEVIDLVITDQSRLRRILENAFAYFHIYLLTGYINYYADKPAAKTTLLMVLKWFLILIPICTSAAGLLFWLCIEEIPEDYSKIVIHDKCWVPEQFIIWEKKVDLKTLYTIIANATNVVLTYLLNYQIGNFTFHTNYILQTTCFRILLTMFFWYITCYYLALFILKYRGDSMFEHGVGQLKGFLKGERINNKLIDKTLDYFTYWWRRTSGVNMKVLMNERIGSIFRQDLNYYFFKKTLQATEQLLHGGDNLKRKLAYYTSELFFLPGEEITREMDLCPHLFIVHRGQVEVSKEGKKIIILTKGSIFGQLLDKKIRPIRITAKAVRKTDVLVILASDFHEIISDKVKQAIANHPHSKNDYMNLKKHIPENPYNTIEYILRGDKAIRFPYIMKRVVRAEKSIWYNRWLFLTMFINPVLCTAFTLFRTTLPYKIRDTYYSLFGMIILTDVIHFLHLVTDFFTMQLTVVQVNNTQVCVYKYQILQKLKDWRFYFDIISLFMPCIFWVTGNNWYLQARLLRIHSVLLYYRLFCGSIKTRTRSIIIKIIMFMLLIHTLVCSHIITGCRTYTGKNFPVRLFPIEEEDKEVIDDAYWQAMQSVKDPVCHVSWLESHYKFGNTTKTVSNFLAPKSWKTDYLISFTFIILVLTTTNIDMVLPVTIGEIYYRILLRLLMYFVSLWITSAVISSVYTSYSEMYNFDYEVNTLLKYLKRHGVSKFIRTTSLRYSKLLWLRTKGNWLPKITYYAPQCLREDILGALYMHHIRGPPIFRDLPEYFLRQLVVRLARTVIFPGKTVVLEGDINSCIYFIHEGEVERWYTDKLSGDQRLLSVLTTSEYFGLLPGLFPNTPYEFSYCTRTVVDFVYLELKTWQDLLDGYPDIKKHIYTAAKKME